jgi:glycosyltransferase involved in cell wall biosynthesis
VEIRVNLSAEELQELYRKARIFWHFSGLHQSDPARIEHFGMTTVEAMQNGAVPVVFNGGGQREVVEEGVSGRLFRDEEDLQSKTLQLIGDPSEMIRLSSGARESGRRFTKAVFMEKARKFFLQVADEYSLSGS